MKLNKREGVGLTKRGELKRTRVIVNPQPLWRKEEKLVRNDTSRSDQLAVRVSRLTRSMFFFFYQTVVGILHGIPLNIINVIRCEVINIAARMAPASVTKQNQVSFLLFCLN